MSARPLGAPRRGVALPAALAALALLAALSVGGVVVARDDLRAAQALAAGVRARAAAEAAAAYDGAHWDVGRNLRLAVGAVDSTTPPVGADATVRTVRAGLRTFVLEGRATVPAGPPGGARVATRRVRLLVRLRHVDPGAEGAVTVAGALDVGAGATVGGIDTPPPGWTDCGAWEEVPGAIPAVAAADAAAVRADPGATVVGGVRASARAGLPASYEAFGEETWRSLATRATVVVEGAQSPVPTGGGGECEGGWGEPRRGAGAVGACAGVSPIVLARGPELALRGPARGQGILLVDGDLRVTGEVEWAGLVVVRGVVRAGAGALRIRGALMIASAGGRGVSALGAGSEITHSSCAVARASIAAAGPAPLGRRAWAEVTR